MADATPTSIPLLQGRYRIEAKLGTGRLAVVYRSFDERLQRPVLIHMMRRELIAQEPLRQRFIQESHASAQRSHQSLLEVFDSGEVAGRPFMITEYVAGRTLRELAPLALEDALLYFRQIVGAVAVCQAAGVPHPPISSNNIILIADGHVELLENWLIMPADLAIDGASYRAPERVAGRPATPASVIYALGLLLIEMLTGQRPVTGDDPHVIAQAHLTARIPTLAEIRPTIFAPSLERLIQRATARAPEMRFPNAVALEQALDELRHEIAGDTRRLEQPPTRPPSLRERIERTTGRMAAPRIRQRQAAPARQNADAFDDSLGAPDNYDRFRRRSVMGITILITFFLIAICGAYYTASLALERLANVQLPRPSINLPIPGISLPDWLTGVASGGGDVLIVTIGDIEGLNLRDAPGTGSNVIALLPNGTRVRKVGGPQTIDNVAWVQVRVKLDDQEQEGWVAERFVKPA